MFKKSLLIMTLLALLAPWAAMGQTTVYETDFEDMNTYSAPTNWKNLGGTIQVQSNGAINDSKSLRFGGNSTTNIVVMPSLSAEINTLQIVFNQKSSNTDAGDFEVGYVTNDSDATTFVAISSYTASSYITASEVTVSLSSAPQGARIAFYHLTTTAYKYWYIDNVRVEVPATSCSTPTGLSATPTSTTADVTWTAGNNETAWQLYYSNNPADDPDAANEEDLIDVTTTPAYTISDLTPNTEYFVYVRAKCNENEYSNWTAAESFTTLYTAKTLPYSYDFEDADELNYWTMRDNSPGTTYYPPTGISDTYSYSSSHSFMFQRTSGYETQYLISPEFSGTSLGIHVQLYHKQTNAGATLQIGYSTTNNATESFTWEEGTPNQAFSSFTSYEYLCPSGTKYVAIRYSATSYTSIFIDDIAFTNAYDKIFTYNENGLWNEASNWNPSGEPNASQNVLINGSATIPNGCIAMANNITLGTGSITIANGGQLKANNAITATVQKEITGYGDDNTVNTGWYFIASPIDDEGLGMSPSNITNLISDSHIYDLYEFNQSAETGLEWVNYKNPDGGFDLYNGHGYLYASSETVSLEFNGSIKPANDDVEVSLEYDPEAEFAGWNLVGNPFTFNAYVNRSYYTMTTTSNTPVAVNNNAAIPPCTGILVQAMNDSDNSVTFTQTAQSNANNGNLQMTVAQQATNRDAAIIDNAVVNFNEGDQLSKFYFGNPAANLYIPQNGKEYAIVSSNGQGEMPVNFKVREDGTYTLTVNPENVEMNYLHLIDNMTGADIDLLQTPSYSFNATTRDYESRFRLVFSVNSIFENEDSNNDFAFFSNGSLIVNNEGQATLQVVDLMGRVLSSETIDGCHSMSLNVAPGVYMIRLVNGNDVKVQKMVVK
jgi:hypothetical protein